MLNSGLPLLLLAVASAPSPSSLTQTLRLGDSVATATAALTRAEVSDLQTWSSGAVDPASCEDASARFDG